MHRIIENDVRVGLAQLPDQSAHCIVTSPPYWGLRAYGTEPQVWDGDPDCLHEWGGGFCCRCGAWRGELGLEPDPDLWVSHIVGIFRAVRRVLRDDGTIWLNIGDAYTGSGKGQMGDGTASDRRGAKQSTSAGTTTGGLPILRSQRRPSDRVDHGGWSAGRLESTRIGAAYNLPAKSLLLLPFRIALALQDDGWIIRKDIIWAKPSPMPESVSDRPTSAHEYLFLISKRPSYYYDQEAIREPLSGTAHARGSGVNPKAAEPGTRIRANTSFSRAVRYLQGGRQRATARGSMRYAAGYRLAPERRGGCAGLQTRADNPAGRNARSVWTISPEPQSVDHYASYPTELVRRCVAAGTSEQCCAECGAPWRRRMADPVPVAGRGSRNRVRKLAGAAGNDRLSTHMGSSVPREPTKRALHGWEPSCGCDAPTVPATVLDPFAGTGTTGVAALQLGRSFVGIELKPAYVRMAERRLSRTVAIVVPEHVGDSDSPQQVRMLL